MGLIKVLQGNGQFNEPLIQRGHFGRLDGDHGGGFPDIRATQAESDRRTRHRRRWGYACPGPMLISAQLLVSNSSSAEAGAPSAATQRLAAEERPTFSAAAKLPFAFCFKHHVFLGEQRAPEA